MTNSNETVPEATHLTLDSATQVVTAFRSWEELLGHCRDGFVPTLNRALFRGDRLGLEAVALIRKALLEQGLRVFPLVQEGESPRTWLPVRPGQRVHRLGQTAWGTAEGCLIDQAGVQMIQVRWDAGSSELIPVTQLALERESFRL